MMNRWNALALLFTVRLAMAFQFQAIAALSPSIMQTYGVGLGDIGLLIGLYLSPGIILAIPGGAIGQRYGDKQAVLFGLGLMIAGGLIVALLTTWPMQIAGRLLAGTGGVLLNVLMSKMVTDRFAGKEIATAMGIFVNSWPVGIALALVALPTIEAATSLTVAMFIVAGFAVFGFLLLALFYRNPDQATAIVAERKPLAGNGLAAVVTAGLVWGLYNAALAMVFGFGPAMLVERGWSIQAASSTTSIVLWVMIVSMPLGGILTDRTGRRNLVLVAGFITFAITLVIAARSDAVLACFIALGIFAGLTPGPIMSLPASVLSPANRAMGMGVFFTLFYACVVAAPFIAGYLAEKLVRTGVAFDLGAIMLAGCCVLLVVYEKFRRQIG